MRNYTLEAFSDEMRDIIKQADVMRDVGDPISHTPSMKDRVMGMLGPQAMNLGMGAMTDIMSGRNIAHDMTELAERVRSPSKLAPLAGPGARMYFLGPKGGGAGNRLAQGLALLGTGFTALEAANALKKDDPTGQGRSRAARLSSLAGRIGGGVLGSSMGGTAGAITGMAGEALGSGIGAGIDYLTGHKAKKKTPQFEDRIDELAANAKAPPPKLIGAR